MSTRLDALVQRAREVGVREDHARAYVAGLATSSVMAKPRRVWVPWLVGAFGLAAAAVMLLLLLRPSAQLGAAISIGDRVAIIAEPATRYRIARTTPDQTIVEVDRGTVTARLWPGALAHRLVLRGGAIEAVATGTVYSLTVDDRGGASVAVHEGKVSVGSALAEPGRPWPDAAPTRGAASARRLLAAPPPTVVADAAPPDARPDAGPDAAPDAAPDAGPVAPLDAAPLATIRDASPGMPPDAAPPDAGPAILSLNERWRRARLQRGQGSYDAAVSECLVIADARDKTWSPIALVEAIRIELGPLTSPERALVLADRFAREWPSHDLAPEARELRCRALRQLGREAECSK